MNEDSLELDNLLEGIGIKLSCNFIPFSSIHNNKEEKSLNWEVNLSSNYHQMKIKFMKGIGFLPFPSEIYLNDENRDLVLESINTVVETGVLRKFKVTHNKIKFYKEIIDLPSPTLKEVLYCLIKESEVKNFKSYEDCVADKSFINLTKELYQDCLVQSEEFIKLLNGNYNYNKIKDLLIEKK